MEMFTGFGPKALIARPAYIKEFVSSCPINEKIARNIVRINDLHKQLEVMHKTLDERNGPDSTKTQRILNAKTKVVQINFHAEDYVMVHSARARRHKLNV